LKTLGTGMVSLLASPLAEMMVTVGLDMVAIVGGVLWLVVVEVGQFWRCAVKCCEISLNVGPCTRRASGLIVNTMGARCNTAWLVYT